MSTDAQAKFDKHRPTADMWVNPDDSTDLAREVAAAFSRMVKGFQEYYKLTTQEACTRAAEPAADQRTQVMNAPPDQISWFDLCSLEKLNPELVIQRWEEIKQAAREELNTGHRAARLMEFDGNSCWPRARFLAIRAELRDAWRPRDAQEAHLIDQMAQCQTFVERWQEVLVALTSLANLGLLPRNKLGESKLPRVAEVEAIREAAELIERFQKLYWMALRALQNQRRLHPRILIRRAKQVNFGNGIQIQLSPNEP
jgi:hypothetical protein